MTLMPTCFKSLPVYRTLLLLVLFCHCFLPAVVIADDRSTDGKSSSAFSVFHPLLVVAQANSGSAPSSPTPYDQCVEAMNAGDYGTALLAIQEAIAQSPTNLDYHYMMGKIYFQMDRYEEAENIFQTLLRKDPAGYQKCYFDLAAVSVKQGKYTQALDLISKARPIDDGQADYETGLVYMASQKPDQALTQFEQAMSKKPELAYSCMIQQTRVYIGTNQPKEARKILNRVLVMDLSPKQQQETNDLMASITDRPASEKPWFLSVSAGMQYDDNVFQDALDQVSLSPVTGGVREKDDVAYLATLYGRYDVWKNNEWKSGLSYSHYQLMYRDLTENNLIGARPSAYIQWNRNPYAASLEYAFNRYWVDEDPRVDVHALLPRLAIMHKNQFQSEFYGGIEGRFYKDETPDARHYFLGFNEYRFFKQGQAHVRAGYMFDFDDYVPDVRGDLRGHQFQTAVNFPLWENRIRADVCGVYLYRHMDYDANIDSDEKRRDNEYHINVSLYGDIASNVTYSAGYFQTFNDSNVTNDESTDPYHFRRAVYSIVLSYIF